MDPTTRATTGLPTSYFEALLGRIRDGDEAAKDELIRDAYPLARRLTRLILRGEFGEALRGHADQVCNDSYEKFARKLKAGLRRDFADFGEMKRYLAGVIRNTATDEVRTRRGPKFRVQFPATGLPSDCAEGAARPRLRFDEIIEGLTGVERRVVELRYLYDFDESEIAEALDLSRSTVARKRCRALTRLMRDFDAP